jgi:hypothetical protein
MTKINGFFMLAGVLGVAAIVQTIDPAPRAPRPAPLTPAQARAEIIGALGRRQALAALSALRQAMREPSSFELIAATGTADGTRLCIVYRARNGFGGMNVEGATVRGGMLRTHATRCKRGPVDYAGLANLL